ncbi:hypothetical protein CUC15_14365 [Oceanobacillus zhaokaii]|jgi:uncharacterized protein YpiB (UPF0302 family)|uniref:IDEAL domain-containing protein n=1 Tax=Oceanobacillus zhaokaii TaxID=2052660 RepID=A0A345PJ58_9BACI|nr:hypothetical protein [Oceanobacillus zhaokaii]AXI10038.1 hypothetical protein CUC15_14365 [Oceanobacillus zhaokaii]
MVTVKMLKPYYIKADENYVRIMLAYQYFSIVMEEKVYQFIPVEANEIKINRKTKKVENIDARFAFQNEKDVVYVTMAKLMTLPDFQKQLDSIAESYYFKQEVNIDKVKQENETALIIAELEKLNVRRMIDRALDERDEVIFNELVKLL